MIKPIENILNKQIDRILNLIKDSGEKQVYISQLTGSFKSLLLSKLIEKEKQILILLPEIKLVEEVFVELSILGLSDKLISIIEFRPESLQEKLTDIINRKSFILISSYKLLNYEFPEKGKLEQQTTKINSDAGIKYDELIEYLNLLNYQKDKFVEAPGEYSQRGSIIDFWSYSERNPVRLEFDGDFLESIRYFDPESQRSIETIGETTLAGSLANGKTNTYQGAIDIFAYLDDPLFFVSSFEIENLYDEKIDVFNPVEEESPKNEPEEIETVENLPVSDFPEETENVMIQEEPERKAEENKIDPEKLYSKENTKWIIEEELSVSNSRIELGLAEAPTINGNYGILFNTLKQYSSEGFFIIITAENELQSARLKDLLGEFKDELAELLENGKVKIETLAIKKGFIHKKEKLLILTDYEIFNKPNRTKNTTSRKYKN